MACWVYLVLCNDNTIYTGVTLDLERRIYEHNHTSIGAKYTATRRPVRLMQAWQVDTWSNALRLEHLVRNLSRKAKEILIKEPEQIQKFVIKKGLNLQIFIKEDKFMPIVQIELLEGRTVEQKRMLAEKVTQAIVESVGAPPENISIIIRDMPKENYAKDGKLAIDRNK